MKGHWEAHKWQAFGLGGCFWGECVGMGIWERIRLGRDRGVRGVETGKGMELRGSACMGGQIVWDEVEMFGAGGFI